MSPPTLESCSLQWVLCPRPEERRGGGVGVCSTGSAGSDHLTKFWVRNRPGDDMTDRFSSAEFVSEEAPDYSAGPIRGGGGPPSRFRRDGGSYEDSYGSQYAGGGRSGRGGRSGFRGGGGGRGGRDSGGSHHHQGFSGKGMEVDSRRHSSYAPVPPPPPPPPPVLPPPSAFPPPPPPTQQHHQPVRSTPPRMRPPPPPQQQQQQFHPGMFFPPPPPPPPPS